ncbi:M15 family metallopeptidase [Arsukibacterium sp.]|uniref:M15 family metallopeptidase n=1 Tax=Arsukibacterium sp. TaxID=1977258 RepID=UPI002FD958EC
MPTLNITPQMLTGRSQQHLCPFSAQHLAHAQMLDAWLALCKAAMVDGISLQIVSAFRSFERQAAIWQAKCNGQRPVYNLQQQIVDITQLSGLKKLEAIMLYSALPGASRHHWGTELDLYDAAAVSSDYQPQLLTTEYQAGGPFARMDAWLTTNAENFGFFRPYLRYQGGVAAEPWHLSYAPLSQAFLAAFSVETLRQALLAHPIAEQQCVLSELPYLYQHYVENICDLSKQNR